MAESKLDNWQRAFKKESWGDKNFGLEILVSVDRKLNDNDSRAMYKLADQIEFAIMKESYRLDPAEMDAKMEEEKKLLALFGTKAIMVEEIPNGYCSQACCSMRPWYKIGWRHGWITIGWRKSVISISWEGIVGVGHDSWSWMKTKAEDVFPDWKPTKFDRTIHAYGYEQAQEIITKLLEERQPIATEPELR